MKILALLALCFATSGTAFAAPPSLSDTLLSRLVGHWKLSGNAAGAPAKATVDGTWVLNRAWIQLRFNKDTATAKAPHYEALVYIGYDRTTKRYIAHWLDIFGAPGAEVAGFGVRTGNTITFLFNYAESPFKTQMSYDAANNKWHIHYLSRNRAGKWDVFGDEELR